jgi:hypothetical protein
MAPRADHKDGTNGTEEPIPEKSIATLNTLRYEGILLSPGEMSMVLSVILMDFAE